MNFTRRQLQDELDEKTKDLEAFSAAREIVRRRVIEVKDSESQLTPLPSWSGTDAVLGSMDLAIHAIERTVEELKALLEDSPVERSFRVIQGGTDEHED